MNDPLAWINGEFVPVSQARLHVFDLGIVGGVAVAEMWRTFRHAIFRPDEHLARLEQSLQLAGLYPAVTMNELRVPLQAVVTHNTQLIDAADDVGVIVFVTAGLNPTYVGREAAQAAGCSIGMHTFPLPYGQWAAKYETGVALVVPSVRAVPADVVDPRIKSRSRLHWHRADQAVRQIDPGATAILLNHHGELTETAAANLIAVINSTLVSPPPRSVLEGISLGVTLELARDCGFVTERRAITPAELSLASEAFLSSTPCCILPVTRFEGLPIGDGIPGEIYRRLLSAWNAHVDIDIAAQMQRR